MPLTDVKLKQTKASEKLVKLSDGAGLQLWIYPNGLKRWRMAYSYAGKQKMLTLGAYPEISLAAARDLRHEAKKGLKDGHDPAVAKKSEKFAKEFANATTFSAIAGELLQKKRREQKADRTMEKFDWFLRLCSDLGPRPIAEITAPEILALLRPIEARGNYETVKKLRGFIGAVFRFAVATGRANADPTYSLKGALANVRAKPRAAIIDPKGFGGLLRAIRDYDGAAETRAALELIAVTFVRPGELRLAEWDEFDLDAGVWSISADKMKMRRPHRVPLAPQSLEIIDRIKKHRRGQYLFPSIRSATRPMSENTLNAALRRLGFTSDEMCSHGFRSTASSILNESGLFNPDAIERQLAHAEKDPIKRAYARGEHWEERIKMMHWWADYCDRLCAGDTK